MTQRTPTSHIARRVAVLATAGLLFAACGSNSDSEPVDSVPVTTTAPASPGSTTTVAPTAPSTTQLSAGDLPDVEASLDESETATGVDVEAPLDEPSGECAESDCTEPTDEVEPQEPEPQEPEPDEPVDDDVEPGIDVIEEPNDEPPFVPAAGDAAFCAANEAFGDGEQPDDEAEVALIAQGFIVELIVLAPDDLRPDLEVFLEFVDRVVAGEADFDAAETEPEVERAGERISDFIDRRCEGRGEPIGSADDGAGDDVAPDPDLPNGLVIPMVPISGEIRGTNTPYFGETGDDGAPADPQPGFVRNPADAGFCDAVDIINHRPQPREDFEEIVVGQQYLTAIESLVPAEISAPYTVLLDWVRVLVENGSFDGIEEPEDDSDLDAAIDDVDSFVNSRCLGL